MSKVTKLNPRNVADVGPIRGTPIAQAIEEQREVAWDVEAVLRMAASALDEISGQRGGTDYSRVLLREADKLDELAGALESAMIEDRAIEIAKALKELEAAGGAA